MSDSLTVFISYAHADKALRAALEQHLSALKHEGLIRLWHDRLISGGQEWAKEIDRNLDSADVILLLISPAFMASSYCYGIEMTRAMERHDAGEARTVPIILRPVDWGRAPFGKLQALPEDAKAVTLWANRDTAFLDVANGLRKLVEEEIARRAARSVSVRPPVAPSRPAAERPPAAAPPDLAKRRRLYVDALAEAFNHEPAVDGLLLRAGIPKHQLRPFGAATPLEYWESVWSELDRGLTEGGVEALLQAAAAKYPYHALFKQWRA